MTALLSQFGIVDEVTYGTPVTVTRFYEVDGLPDIKPGIGRAQSTANRQGSRALVATKFVPYKTGATQQVSMPVPTKGFGLLLKHMLGSLSTGAASDSNYPHTATVGTLFGKMFTGQIGLPRTGTASTVDPKTGHGGKIVSWELSCDLDGLLMVTLDIDYEDVDTSTGLATASYPSASTVFAFNGAAITYGGSSINLSSFKCGMNNGLDVNRRFLNGTAGLKIEPLENALREITWSADAEFDSLTQYTRFVNTAAASTYGQIVATFTGPIAHAGATLPTLVITIPVARLDDHSISASGAETLKQSLSGIGMYDLTNSPITIVYTTSDATA